MSPTNISTRYFTQREMRCHDGTEYPAIWADRLVELFTALDVIREGWGGPLVIVSGYRTLAHNGAVGGAQQSQHVEGRAVDLRPLRKPIGSGDIHELHALVLTKVMAGELPAVGGLGLYPMIRDKKTHLLLPGWVHVDTRPKPVSGHICRWTGAAIGDEQAV